MIADEDDKGGNGKPEPEKLAVTRRGRGDHLWVKGVSGNPSGNPPDRSHVHHWICKFIEMTPDELKKYISNPHKNLTMAQRGALQVAHKIAKGEYTIIRDMIERDLGKVPLSINLSTSAVSNQIASMDEAQVNERLMEVSRMIGLEQKLLAEGDSDG